MVNTTSILTVMAHADDAELWTGATLARHIRAGTAVTIALPHGAADRDREAAAGAEALGATLHLLDGVTAETVVALITTLRPEVVVTHQPDDIHPDHRAIADAVLAALPDAVIATGCPRRVYACDSYNNLDRHGRPLELPVVIDGTATWDVKLQALHCHDGTQPISGHFGPMAETLGRLHGRRIEREYAEAFRPLPVLGRVPEATAL